MRRALLWAALFLGCTIAAFGQCVTASQVTLAGNLRSANGLPSSNSIITLTPSQAGFIAGCGVNLPQAVTCSTSTDGSVVQTPNPLTATINTTSGGGTLPSGTYYTIYEFYDALGHVTLPSPETVTILSATGSLVVNPPSSGIPATATGIDVFIGTSSGGETLQGQTTGSASFVQSTTLTSGASPGTVNNTTCIITANDSVWPTGTGYIVTMVDSSGNGIPGFPMQWQLMGAGSTINLSNGLPYYHDVVTYPVPVLTMPQNHGVQSISGPLNMTGYNVVNVGKLGVGTSTPGFSIDVTNGLINSDAGYLINGAGGTSGQAPCSDGTAIDLFCNFLPASTALFYQTILNGSHTSDAVTQRGYLAVGSGTGLFAVDAIGVGGQVNRTVLELAPVGGSTTLGADPFAVVTSAGGSTGQLACWDATGGGITGCAGSLAPHRVTPSSGGQPSYPLAITASTQTLLLTETVTFPATTGAYRADVRYGAWITSGANPCAAEVIDTTNTQSYALSGQNSNGTGYIGLSGSEISTFTYAPAAVVVFTLQAVCTNGAGGLVGATENSPTLTFTTNEPTYLSVTPVLSN